MLIDVVAWLLAGAFASVVTASPAAAPTGDPPVYAAAPSPGLRGTSLFVLPESAWPTPVAHARVAVPSGAPRVVTIPALGERFEVDPFTRSLPTGIRVGWAAWSAQPGSMRGTAVLAGHRDVAGGEIQGPLYDLPDLVVGDVIQVEWNARTVTYRVSNSLVTDPHRMPPVVNRRTGRHRLVLTTCVGPRRLNTKDELMHWSRRMTVVADVHG